MRTARSARAGVALGATLIACSLAGISNAEQTSSSANGISVGDTQGISVGDMSTSRSTRTVPRTTSRTNMRRLLSVSGLH